MNNYTSKDISTKKQARFGALLVDKEGRILDVASMESQVSQLIGKSAARYRDVLRIGMMRGNTIALEAQPKIPEGTIIPTLHFQLARVGPHVTDATFEGAVQEIAASIADLLGHPGFCIAYAEAETVTFDFTK